MLWMHACHVPEWNMHAVYQKTNLTSTNVKTQCQKETQTRAFQRQRPVAAQKMQKAH